MSATRTRSDALPCVLGRLVSRSYAAAGVTDSRCAVAGARRHGRYDRVGALVSLPHSPTFAPLIIGAWLVWVAVFGGQLAHAMLAIRRARQRCRSFPLALERRLRNWTRVKHQGRAAPLVVSDDVRAAAVIGCGAPVIAIAPALVQHLTAAELDRIVIHEWAHVQRRDDLGNVVQLMARMLAGWHPGIWWLDRWLRAEREVACDGMAVMQTGSSKVYAACLVKLASLPLASRDTLPALGVLSSGSLASRVERIVSRTGHGSRIGRGSRSPSASCCSSAVSLAIGSLRIVEAVVVSPELETVADALPTPADIANESARVDRPCGSHDRVAHTSKRVDTEVSHNGQAVSP